MVEPHTDSLAERFTRVRAQTRALAAPLCVEDQVVQTMPDVSPTRWHLAHTTWFFETFVLRSATPDEQPFHHHYDVLFNSYYNAVGPQFPRAARGLLSRPTVADIDRYRDHVDRAMTRLLEQPLPGQTAAVIELGLHHEQQHQELILTDIKHVLGANPLLPAYTDAAPPPLATPHAADLRWLAVPGGVVEIGAEHGPQAPFAFDNESPRHRVLIEDFEIASRPVTNAEYLAFIEDGGYQTPALWLSEGWAAIQAEGWRAPLYWSQRDDQWHTFTLHGLTPLEPEAPVCHLSLFEADAFAQWAGARLPTEHEWETAAGHYGVGTAPSRGGGSFVEDGHLRPVPWQAPHDALHDGPLQMLGDVWEWTRSAYAPYPGFRAARGALGEYNGKFMCAQNVLRGGSCATPRDHTRTTYRNFFPPHARWQFSGVRLAR